MKTFFSVLAGAALAGVAGAPLAAAAETHRSTEPPSVGYGVCAKGPCLHVTHWNTVKEHCRNGTNGHGHTCPCPQCASH